MRSRDRLRRRAIPRLEPLESRLALAATVVTPLADITRPSTATTETISLAGKFDDTAVTGTVVQFNVNTTTPNDRIFVELFDQLGPGRDRTTPLTVANFLSYVNDGSYTNTIIHRFARNQNPGKTPFVAQGGGFRAPTVASNQTGGTPTAIPTKGTVLNEPGNSNVRGTIAMAKVDGNANSATNQWFFNLDDNSFLNSVNGGFTAFGRVLGSMAAVDALNGGGEYDRTSAYGGAFGELPLRNAPTPPLPAGYVVQPAQFVTLPSISRVGEFVYTVTSSDPSLVTASVVDVGGVPSLQLDHKPDKSGTATLTVRATSIFNPSDFVDDAFFVTREAPPGPVAPTGLTATAVGGRVRLAWTAPPSGSPITDYVIQSSTNGGSSWTEFADGTSAATSATVTGLASGTSYVFRVAAVNGAGAGAFTPASAAVTPKAVVAVGSEIGATSTPVVRLVDAESGAVIAQQTVFEAGFRGGVRVAMGDLDGDNVPEVVAASGPGRVGEIRVFRVQVSGGTTTLQELPTYRTVPFGTRYTGGVEIAVGNVDADAREDLVAAMSRGGGTVSVFRSVDPAGNANDPIQNTPFRTFTPFGGTFDGGATVAVADVGTFVAGALTSATAADNRVEIVVGSGPGMRPTVRVYDISATPRVVTTLQPLAAAFLGGVSVASGRYDANEIDDIVVSAGRGGGSAMQVFDGRVNQSTPAVLASSTAFAALGRPNAPLFTAPIDTAGTGRISRFLATQGDPASPGGVLHVSTAGVRVGALGSLKGGFRIAAPRRG